MSDSTAPKPHESVEKAGPWDLPDYGPEKQDSRYNPRAQFRQQSDNIFDRHRLLSFRVPLGVFQPAQPAAGVLHVQVELCPHLGQYARLLRLAVEQVAQEVVMQVARR